MGLVLGVLFTTSFYIGGKKLSFFGHVWSLKIMKDENSYTHQTLGFVWEAIKVMIISNFWFKVNQIQHYTKVFL